MISFSSLVGLTNLLAFSSLSLFTSSQNIISLHSCLSRLYFTCFTAFEPYYSNKEVFFLDLASDAFQSSSSESLPSLSLFSLLFLEHNLFQYRLLYNLSPSFRLSVILSLSKSMFESAFVELELDRSIWNC